MPEHARLEPIEISGVPAEWSTTPEADASRAVLYLHGGGYMAGSIVSHRYVAVEIGRAARARTLALGYRLRARASLSGATRGCARRLAIPARSGTCAGIHRCRRRQRRRQPHAGPAAGTPRPRPRAAVLRLADLAMEQPDGERCDDGGQGRRRSDDPEALPSGTRAGLRGWQGFRRPAGLQQHADLAGLPPLLIQVGSDETLLDDAVQLAGRAGAARVPVTLEVWPDMIYAFPMFFPAGRRVPAGDRRRRRIHATAVSPSGMEQSAATSLSGLGRRLIERR